MRNWNISSEKDVESLPLSLSPLLLLLWKFIKVKETDSLTQLTICVAVLYAGMP